MKHFENYLEATDGLKLFCQGWEPADQTRGTIALVHGLGEHSGRYGHLAEYFAERGYSVQSFDLRGHGKSEGKRGHTPSFSAYMDDIDIWLRDLRERFLGAMFLYGHSLGAILTVIYTLQKKPPLAGVVATGLAMHNALEKQAFKLMLVRTLGNLVPDMILPSGLDTKMLSRDYEVVDAYVHDPLVHDRASVGFGAETLKEIAWTWEHACEFPVPLLLMHGSKDQIAYPSSSQEFASLAPGQCTLKMWDGMFHEIHNEYGKEQVFEYLAGWLEARLAEWNANNSV
jgi:acylglycerol lipase